MTAGAAAFLVLAGAVLTHAAAAPLLQPVPRFPIRRDALTITRPVESAKPFSVAGPKGAIFGEQGGSFEAWVFPVKVLSRFGITAELANYPVPIDVSAHAAAIEVAPALTTITYSHAAFTIRQRMFAVRGGRFTGAVVFFEIASVRPLALTFRFQPDVLRMWPAAGHGVPSAEWADGGYYVLHTDDPALTAAVAMPRARPGILAPYQERPRTYPVELKLAFDPQKDADLFFPLLITTALPSEAASELAGLNRNIPQLYRETEEYYQHFFDTRLTTQTPDRDLDRALRWAALAIDQGRVDRGAEQGLVAGYYGSGDSARPGFGWFFGRDALWTSYALNSSGDFALTRQVFEFLIRRQREDGKIMHEFSQTAELVDWKATPYFYAAADSNPLFVMAMEDYVNTSGDTAFLRTHWAAVRRAYEFTRAHDSDGDGIYENTEGTGWVESWPPGMPHQEIYLAALDQQSAESMSRLAAVMKDQALAASATKKAAEIRAKLESEYYEPGGRFYAFSRNADGGLDGTASIYPAVAWWSGRLAPAQPGPMLDRWASAEFSTDWGTRDISDRTSFYDAISYHQGSVWPLFTGWVSLAEYRAGRAMAGYQHLMQNAGLTWAQDLGAVTELLSGAYFQPLGRSSSHQVWSSAMVLTPALRGLFGLDWDALNHTLRLSPKLPATWERALLKNVPLGTARWDVEFTRRRDQLLVRARSLTPEVLCLLAGDAPRGEECRAPAATERETTLPLPEVEVEPPHELPLPGSSTTQLKVTGERRAASRYEIDLEAPAGSIWEMPVRLSRPRVQVGGAELAGNVLRVRFGASASGKWERATVSFTW